jgi:ABC-type amino acid transport substrate-binding protein
LQLHEVFVISTFRLGVLFFLTAGTSAHGADKLKVLYYNFPPHVITEGDGIKPGAPKGTAVDVWEKYVAPAAGVEIEWVGPIPFARALSLLEDGEADAIIFASKNPEREPKYIWPKVPHILDSTGLVVKKSDPLKRIESVKDIQGKSIAKNNSGYIVPFLSKNKDKFTFEESSGDSAPQQIIAKVVAGRVWAGYVTWPKVLMYHAIKEKVQDQLKIISFPSSDLEGAFAAMSKKLDPSMVKRVSDAIEKTGKKYDYPKMLNEYLDQIKKASK